MIFGTTFSPRAASRRGVVREQPAVDTIAGPEEDRRVDKGVHQRLARDFVDGEPALGVGDRQPQSWCFEELTLDAHHEVLDVALLCLGRGDVRHTRRRATGVPRSWERNAAFSHEITAEISGCAERLPTTREARSPRVAILAQGEGLALPWRIRCTATSGSVALWTQAPPSTAGRAPWRAAAR